MRKYIRGIIVILLVAVFTSFFAQPAFAESSGLKVSVKEGIDGKVKRGSGFPVQILVENNGKSFSGDLLIDFYPTYNTGGSIVVRLEIPEKATKTYQVSIPGMADDHPALYQNSAMIHLYEGDWQNGAELDFKGQKTIKPSYIDQSEKILGILSENFDRLKELKSLPSVNGAPVRTIRLEKDQIPEQSLGLEMMDYIVVDEYALSQLNEKQQESIQEWIKGGGVLVAGGAPNASQAYGILYPILPMKTEDESTVHSSFLQDGKRENPGFQELAVFNGTVDKEAIVIYESGSIPVVLKKKYGEGTIFQAGFSLGDEPLSAWNGYGDWFSTLLQQDDQEISAMFMSDQELFDRLYYEFAETNEYFPVSHFSIWELSGFLMVYLLVISPLLYFILRKFDKREQAWWIIPFVAVLVSVLVFAIGAKDRIAQPQFNQMGIYKAENGQLTGFQAATLLSNTGGNYQFSYAKDQFKPIVTNMDMMAGAASRADAVFEEGRKQNQIYFKDVEYWSSRTVYGSAKKNVEGSFQSDLTVKNGIITGTITNHFSYDFKELYVLSGSEKIKLGSLAKGETIKVRAEVKNSLLTAPTTNYTGYNMSPQTKIDVLKKERLFSAGSIFVFDSNQTNNLPIIAGITNQEVISLDLADNKEKENNYNLIVEPFTAKVEIKGEFTLSNDALASRFNVIQGQILSEKTYTPKEKLMEDGEYEYVILLPEAIANKPVSLESIKIRLSDNGNVPKMAGNPNRVNYSILNQQTGQFLSIDKDIFSLTVNENVSDFLSANGEILLKMEKHSGGDPYLVLPSITIKGEVTP